MSEVAASSGTWPRDGGRGRSGSSVPHREAAGQAVVIAVEEDAAAIGERRGAHPVDGQLEEMASVGARPEHPGKQARPYEDDLVGGLVAGSLQGDSTIIDGPQLSVASGRDEAIMRSASGAGRFQLIAECESEDRGSSRTRVGESRANQGGGNFDERRRLDGRGDDDRHRGGR